MGTKRETVENLVEAAKKYRDAVKAEATLDEDPETNEVDESLESLKRAALKIED